MTRRRAVLEARGVSKAYGAVQALDAVDLELRRGEVLGLVGDNGAGKTTLVKCLSGVLRPDSGSILIDGVEHHAMTAEFARTLGIETVYQNLSLVDTLDVTQNFFLNRELDVSATPCCARSGCSTGGACTARPTSTCERSGCRSRRGGRSRRCRAASGR